MNMLKAKKYFILPFILLWLLPQLALAQGSIPSPLHLGQNPTNTVLDIAFSIFAWLTTAIALLTFAFMLISGFRMILAHDNQDALARAKNSALWSAGGFVVAMLSYSLVAGTAAFLSSRSGDELTSPDTLVSPTTSTNFDTTITTIINGILGLSMATAVIMMVYGGYQLITAGGNEQTIQRGKTTLKWAIGGIIFIVLAFSIISAINDALGG